MICTPQMETLLEKPTVQEEESERSLPSILNEDYCLLVYGVYHSNIINHIWFLQQLMTITSSLMLRFVYNILRSILFWGQILLLFSFSFFMLNEKQNKTIAHRSFFVVFFSHMIEHFFFLYRFFSYKERKGGNI